jgi:hypothetical protein
VKNSLFGPPSSCKNWRSYDPCVMNAIIALILYLYSATISIKLCTISNTAQKTRTRKWLVTEWTLLRDIRNLRTQQDIRNLQTQHRTGTRTRLVTEWTLQKPPLAVIGCKNHWLWLAVRAVELGVCSRCIVGGTGELWEKREAATLVAASGRKGSLY